MRGDFRGSGYRGTERWTPRARPSEHLTLQDHIGGDADRKGEDRRWGQRNLLSSREIGTRIRFIFFLTTEITQGKEEGFEHPTSFSTFESGLRGKSQNRKGEDRRGGHFSSFVCRLRWQRTAAGARAVTQNIESKARGVSVYRADAWMALCRRPSTARKRSRLVADRPETWAPGQRCPRERPGQRFTTRLPPLCSSRVICFLKALTLQILSLLTVSKQPERSLATVQAAIQLEEAKTYLDDLSRGAQNTQE